MKSILLASASIVAFAGAASAEFAFSGSATVGWNDDFVETESDSGEPGFYNDLDFDITLSQELDNGVTAAARIGFEYTDSDGDSVNNGTTNFGAFTDDNFLLSLTTADSGLYFGDTVFAAETYWDGVTNMAFDSFSEADGETVIRGEVAYGDITTGASFVIHNDDVAQDIDLVVGGDGTGNLDQLSLGATGEFGAFTFSAAYQAEADEAYDPAFNGDFETNEVFGVSVGTSFAGADVALAYSDEDGDGSSVGVEVAYPVGPVTVTGFYVMNDADGVDVDDNYGVELAYAAGALAVSARYHDGDDEEAAIEGSFDVGNGLAIYAGYIDEMETGAGVQQAEIAYIGAEYDLGGGATLTASYADVSAGDGGSIDTDLDEVGAREYLAGSTVALSFAF